MLTKEESDKLYFVERMSDTEIRQLCSKIAREVLPPEDFGFQEEGIALKKENLSFLWKRIAARMQVIYNDFRQKNEVQKQKIIELSKELSELKKFKK